MIIGFWLIENWSPCSFLLIFYYFDFIFGWFLGNFLFCFFFGGGGGGGGGLGSSIRVKWNWSVTWPWRYVFLKSMRIYYFIVSIVSRKHQLLGFSGNQASAYEACSRTRTPLHISKILEMCKEKHALFDWKSFKVCNRSHV